MAKQTIAMMNATEYKTAASTTTRNICIVGPLVMRLPETLRSIIQMRYASNPEQSQVSREPRHCAHAELYLPEPTKLAASVKEKYAVTHCEVAFA